MPTVNDSLAKAVDELKRVLDERTQNPGGGWVRRMDQALATVEQSARRHRVALKDPERRAVDVDTALNPSPGVARRVDKLRSELDELLREAVRLRKKVQDLHPSAEAMDAATAAGALSVAPEVADVADYGVFLERAEQLLQGFEHLDAEEAALIQESVNLDLGAGD